MTPTPLPIDALLPDLTDALRTQGRAVLQAPPGAGKTTRVPPAILDAGLTSGRIVMLEPRRLAARTAADRMAAERGEIVGQTVGYRIRGEARAGPDTRIEVVTEGILTRMIQSDPELTGIGAILFDEFHERSLNADLGLALALECRTALRPDLLLVVMSATLDAAPVAALMDDAPILTAEGRAYPVDLHWLDAPRRGRWEGDMVDLIQTAAARTPGSLLAFLPGGREIARVQGLLAQRLPPGTVLRPLYGAMPLPAQRAAIAPEPSGRKIVLATSIAETSLTIEGITGVVDGGLARRARFDPGSGMSRLVTEKVTRAEATQRAGRAGRLGPGHCWRLWTKGEDGALADHPPAEIATADLTGLALELAVWGADDLPFLTPPPDGALAEARALLRDLGALDHGGGITPHGRALAGLPLHPRLAHMLAIAGRAAAPLAALLADRDPLPGRGADLSARLDALRRTAGGDPPALSRLRAETARLARSLAKKPALSTGAMTALAYPDRVGLRRPGGDPRWLLSGGKGATLPADDALSGERLLVAADLDGNPREARIHRAARLDESDLRALYPDRIFWVETCDWDTRAGRVRAQRAERFGALALATRPWPDAPADAVALAMLEGVRTLGLAPSPAARRLAARVALARAAGVDLPDFADEALLAEAEDWLLPWLTGLRTAEDWRRFDLLPALSARLDHARTQQLDRVAPAQFTTPLGRRVPVDYDSDPPGIELRLQEVFGVTAHPTLAGRPLRLTLLSPARRPIQITTDLPGFWANTYAEVRKDMRGRYPRHPWPEDPTAADPTLRAKSRGA